jgi:hypothetical protein
MEQVVIIVIIGLISLVNWVVKRSAEIREERKLERERLGIPEGDPFHSAPHQAEKPEPPHRPAIAPSPDMRRLMEALGLPQEEEESPPMPVVREAPAPPLPIHKLPAAPKPRADDAYTPEATGTKHVPRSATRNAVSVPPATAPVSPLAAALRSRDGIRQAVVLREILGPPKAFTA